MKYSDISDKIDTRVQELEKLENADRSRTDIQKKINEFRKLLNENRIVDEFDRAVFESIVDYVIVGGYDDKGNKDPEMISFVYKTGFKDLVGAGKYRTPRKVRVVKSDGSQTCSLALTDGEILCSESSLDAR